MTDRREPGLVKVSNPLETTVSILEWIVLETLTETDRTERTTLFDGDDTNMTGTHGEPALNALDRLEGALDAAAHDRLARALVVPHRLQP